jgi:hypothetical protein
MQVSDVALEVTSKGQLHEYMRADIFVAIGMYSCELMLSDQLRNSVGAHTLYSTDFGIGAVNEVDKDIEKCAAMSWMSMICTDIYNMHQNSCHSEYRRTAPILVPLA